MLAAVLILLGLIALIVGAVALARGQFLVSERRAALGLLAAGIGLIFIGAIVAALTSGPSGPAATPTPTATVSPTPAPSPTPTATPSPTPTPPPTVTPTPTPSPTPTPTPSPTPEASPTTTPTLSRLIDVPASMSATVDQFQAQLGAPFLIANVSPGQLEAAPNGGEARSYQQEWGILEGIFNDERLTGLFMLVERSYPANFQQALTLLNLPTDQEPDVDTPTERRWNDLAGFSVILTADRPNGEVTQISVWEP